MNWTAEELGFILYNNRSVRGVVKNFIPPSINPFRLIKIEGLLKQSKLKFQSDDRWVEICREEITSDFGDVIVRPEDLWALTDEIFLKCGEFSNTEINFLLERGIGPKVMWKWRLLGLSSISDAGALEKIGATVHPALKKFLDDGLAGGGVVIPLFDSEGKLINCAIRKISIENASTKTLKYSLASPDVPVWGLSQIAEGDEFWITEGIFDTMAMYEMGEKSISCSSAMWSGIQLYQVLQKKPPLIKIFSDNDQVGLRTSAILKDFFSHYEIPSKIYISEDSKDASELYFLKKGNLSSLKEIEVTNHMIEEGKDHSFNFINHLKTRKF